MRTTLQKHLVGGEVLPWEPTLPGDPCIRTLLITKEINEGFDQTTWTDAGFAHRFGMLAGDFDRFVGGDTLPIGWDPYDKDDSAFMARVDPAEYGVWTLRSVAPRPALRVFGAFCERDVFVALTVFERRELGGRGDRRWNLAREAAIEHWNRLFQPHPRLTGDSVDDFFFEKAIVV